MEIALDASENRMRLIDCIRIKFSKNVKNDRMIKTKYVSERKFRELSTGVNYNHVRQKSDSFFFYFFPSMEDYANMRL